LKQVEPKKEDKDSEDKHTNVEMSIGGPLALWIGLVAVAGVMQLFIFPALQNGGIVYPALATLNHIAAYGLYVPGVLVLPILAALWIGSRAGSTEGKINTVTYRAMINAVYASVIYLIEIFVLYIIANSTHTSVLSAVSLGLFVELVVALPVIVCIIVAPLFAIVSSARRF
jgi:hypothetical protein